MLLPSLSLDSDRQASRIQQSYHSEQPITGRPPFDFHFRPPLDVKTAPLSWNITPQVYIWPISAQSANRKHLFQPLYLAYLIQLFFTKGRTSSSKFIIRTSTFGFGRIQAQRPPLCSLHKLSQKGGTALCRIERENVAITTDALGSFGPSK